MMIIKNLFVLCALIFCQALSAQYSFSDPKNNPEELGEVSWLRDHDQAVQLSKEKGLPILILFQEVPGCSNCTTYGNGPLSHDLLVEAIESHFIPLAIYNNKGGKDARILKQYGEPTWNNPVVRIVNVDSKDLTKRLSSDFSYRGLLNSITSGLQKSNQVIPAYLSILNKELSAVDSKKEANLAMYCFWTGEKEIARIPGVLSTEAGYMHGKEVVKLEYDSDLISLDEIVKKASKKGCADEVYVADKQVFKDVSKKVKQKVKTTSKYRKDAQDKYYLRQTKYRNASLTPLQQTLVNSAIARGEDPISLLSPRQLKQIGD